MAATKAAIQEKIRPQADRGRLRSVFRLKKMFRAAIREGLRSNANSQSIENLYAYEYNEVCIMSANVPIDKKTSHSVWSSQESTAQNERWKENLHKEKR